MELYLPWDKPKQNFFSGIGDKSYDGHVQWSLRDKATGLITPSFSAKNTVTFLATNVMAHAIAGIPGYKITHIYGEHADPGFSGYIDGSLNGLSSSRSDTVDILRTSPRATTGAESAVLTTAFGTTTEILMVPTSDYDSNLVTFTAILSDPSLNGRIFVGAGLMTVIGTSEILFAHQYRPALTKLSSFDILIAWTIRYL